MNIKNTTNSPLIVRPAFLAFDAHQALSWIKAEADWVGLRFVQEHSYQRSVRNQRPQNNTIRIERGVMVEAVIDGNLAYAGTSDLSQQGLLQAVGKAAQLARTIAPCTVLKFSGLHRPTVQGRYTSAYQAGFDSQTLGEFTDQLVTACRYLQVSDKIVNAHAEANLVECWNQYVSTSGTDIYQQCFLVNQHFSATAKEASEIQQRSLNGSGARCRQAGLEFFDFEAIHHDCQRIAEEALALLSAENCPDETLDVILAADQMPLQIHESVGHPLELDRILGDERNYAGWSFVKPEDFGQLQYGSKLMNVTFDPTVDGEFASYGFDDCGHPASREYLIKDGLLLRGLGSLESQSRLKVPGVANVRATSWNRAPIDRMANINLEPGSSSLAQMIASVERGVYMGANKSWSIDDYRNKFQFGCEYARLIENGQLTKVLKNPNYRGVSVPFWQALQQVGNQAEWQVFGTPYCGKGEPNQIIRVGHAAPPCLFSGVEVFGGGQ
jgi:predicted Zn-dependent protease